MILVIGCGFLGETVAKSLEQNDQPVFVSTQSIMITQLICI